MTSGSANRRIGSSSPETFASPSRKKNSMHHDIARLHESRLMQDSAERVAAWADAWAMFDGAPRYEATGHLCSAAEAVRPIMSDTRYERWWRRARREVSDRVLITARTPGARDGTAGRSTSSIRAGASLAPAGGSDRIGCRRLHVLPGADGVVRRRASSVWLDR